MSFNYSGGFVGNKPNPLPIALTPIDNSMIATIPLEEVASREDYSDMADLAVIFNHEIIEEWYLERDKKTIRSTWKWREFTFRDWDMDIRSPNLNHINQMMQRGQCSIEEYMKFNMQLGYSLCGFAELFGQHEASEYELDDSRNDPHETVIEYMRRVHKGKILFNDSEKEEEVIECVYKNPKPESAFDRFLRQCEEKPKKYKRVEPKPYGYERHGDYESR